MMCAMEAGKRGARVWVTHFLPKAGVNGDGGRGESAS